MTCKLLFLLIFFFVVGRRQEDEGEDALAKDAGDDPAGCDDEDADDADVLVCGSPYYGEDEEGCERDVRVVDGVLHQPRSTGETVSSRAAASSSSSAIRMDSSMAR